VYHITCTRPSAVAATHLPTAVGHLTGGSLVALGDSFISQLTLAL